MSVMMLLGIALLIFLIAMLLDCAQRSFRNNTEKIVWIALLAISMFLAWLPPFVYFIVIRHTNPRGLSAK
jgi:hypothetical protein